MASDAAHFFESFFRELEKRGIPYAILHGYERLPEEMASDIDFVVRREDLPNVLPIQREIAGVHGWALVNVVKAKLSAQFAVFVNPEDPCQYIQLDVCGDYIERGCFVLSNEQLLAGRRAYKFFNVPAPSVEFAYLLAKALLKEKSLELVFPRLRELWRLDAMGAEALFGKFGAGGLEQWFGRLPTEWELELRPKIRAITRFGLANRLRELARMVGRISLPTGLHIAIYGPDGVGKSTLISRLMLPCFRQARQIHFRPGVLGKKARGPVDQPHGESPRSQLASLAKVLYYFADHCAGYLSRVFPAKIRNELVIFDRSFADVLVDPRRYRLSGGRRLARCLSKLLPAPDMTFVLDADPEMVHARKPELEIAELRVQRDTLRHLAAEIHNCSIISAAQSPEEVLRAVQREMIQFLARREKSRQRD